MLGRHGKAADGVDQGPDHRIARSPAGKGGLEIGSERIQRGSRVPAVERRGCGASGAITGTIDDVVGATTKRVERRRPAPFRRREETDRQRETRPAPAEQFGAEVVVRSKAVHRHPVSVARATERAVRPARPAFRQRESVGRTTSVS